MSLDAKMFPFFWLSVDLLRWRSGFLRRVKALELSGFSTTASWEELQSHFSPFIFWLECVLLLQFQQSLWKWFVIRPSPQYRCYGTDGSLQQWTLHPNLGAAAMPVNRHALQIFTTFAPSHFAWGGAGCCPIACWDCVPLYFKLSL